MNMIFFGSHKFEGGRDTAGRPERFRSGKPGGNRRGSLLAEVGISTVVLMIVMGLTLKVLATIAQERRAAADRQLGALETGNLMERITAHPFDQVTPELARRISVSDLTRRSLRDCELALSVSGGEKSAAGVQSAKRVMIRLRWKGPSGQWQAPVRLTSWIEPGVPHP
jgi:hypothetical protein